MIYSKFSAWLKVSFLWLMISFTHALKYKGRDIHFKITVFPAGEEAEVIKIHGKSGDVEILSYRPYYKKTHDYHKMEYHLITCPKDFDLSQYESLARQVIIYLNQLA